MNIRIGHYPTHIRVTYPHASHALTTRTRARSLAPSPEHASFDVHALATLTTRARSRSRARQRASPQHCTPIPTLPYECKRARDRFDAERESPLG